jgi:Glycosyltransferase family 87
MVRTAPAMKAESYGDWPYLLTLSFLPVIHALTHGQLSIMVLTVFLAHYRLLRTDRRFQAGLILAFGLVKFNLIAGYIAILVLRKQCKEMSGFLVGLVAFVLISVSITGGSGALKYPSVFEVAEYVQVTPQIMPSLRGLLFLITQNRNPILWTTLLSGMAIAITVRKEEHSAEVSFIAASIASLLVAYHLHSYDLCLLQLPFLVGRSWNPSRALTIYGAVIVFWATRYFALFSLVLVILLLECEWIFGTAPLHPANEITVPAVIRPQGASARSGSR